MKSRLALTLSVLIVTAIIMIACDMSAPWLFTILGCIWAAVAFAWWYDRKPADDDSSGFKSRKDFYTMCQLVAGEIANKDIEQVQYGQSVAGLSPKASAAVFEELRRAEGLVYIGDKTLQVTSSIYSIHLAQTFLEKIQEETRSMRLVRYSWLSAIVALVSAIASVISAAINYNSEKHDPDNGQQHPYELIKPWTAPYEPVWPRFSKPIPFGFYISQAPGDTAVGIEVEEIPDYKKDNGYQGDFDKNKSSKRQKIMTDHN